MVWQPDERNLEVLRAISDPVRFRILELIGREPRSVTQLIEVLKMGKALVSYHLKVLRQAEVVDTERRSYFTYYAINPIPLKALSNHLRSLIGERAWMMPDLMKNMVAIDIPEQIRKYAELRDASYLTPEEFEEAKSDLLGRLRK